MKKKIIIILVLLATIFISGCIDSTINDINKIVQELNQDIITGDSSYNEVVKYVNNHDYNTADSKIKTTISSFNNAQNTMLKINEYTDELNETLYIEYFELIKKELSFKQNATSKLQLAIESFRLGDNETANEHVSQANSLMNQGIYIQNQREEITKKHPEKFNH